MSGNHQHNVLRDHKKVGKRFIPPLLQIPNMQETSFRDNVLPCLVWVSAIFLRNKDRTAVHNVIQFLIKCGEILHDEKSPPLVFLNNFNRLTQGQKQSIKAGVESEPFYTFIRSNVAHQEAIFKDYPLGFLFESNEPDIDRAQAVEWLKADVDALLDRYSMHSTKVQTTTFVSMTATGKAIISSEVDLPDFNAIFTAPDSDESRRVSSFVRASLNSGPDFLNSRDKTNLWANSFWRQCFDLEACT